MSDDASTPSPDPTVSAAVATPVPSSAAGPTGQTEPQLAPPKRKRKKYSRNLGALQEAERAASKAAHRVARAVEKGLASYREERDRSARKKRDGALRDLPANVAHGVAEAARAASKAPADLAGALDSRQVRRLLRRGVRIALSPFSR